MTEVQAAQVLTDLAVMQGLLGAILGVLVLIFFFK